jgi:hypothetical protein
MFLKELDEGLLKIADELTNNLEQYRDYLMAQSWSDGIDLRDLENARCEYESEMNQ